MGSKDDFYPISQSRLPNGLTVLRQEWTGTRTLVSIYFKMGYAIDHNWNPGLFHCLEHSVFLRTKKMGKAQIDRWCDRLGYVNAETEAETVCFYVDTDAGSLEEALQFLAETTQSYRFRRDELDRELGVLREEFTRYVSDPWYGLFRVINQHVWRGSRLATTEYEVKGLQDVPLSDLRKLASSTFTAQRSVVSVLGAHSKSKVNRLVEKYFGSLPAGVTAPKLEQGKFKPGVKVVRKPVSVTYFGLALPSPPNNSADCLIGDLLDHYIVHLYSSPIQEFVRSRGLSYGVYVYPIALSTVGTRVFSGGVHRRHTNAVLQRYFEEIDRLRAGVIDERLFSLAIENYSRSARRGCEGFGTEIARASKELLASGQVTQTVKYLEKIVRTQPRDFQRFAELYLTKPASLVVYGDTEGLEISKQVMARCQ